MSDRWISLLGSELEPALLQKVGLDIKNSTKVVLKDCEIYNFYDAGVSFVIVNNKIDSIDFFFRNKSFRPCQLVLPYNLDSEFTGSRLLEVLGEPLEKGGGTSSNINIWLRWKNLQIELDDKSWETAKDALIKSITIFN
ncbi:hypothetical protein KL905_001147 [Ogataea polymorpha]|uniref:Uncharacterized protein n=1 Tax=Ogataea polymorpha TaxID=460523 RepID=A0A9P8PEC1_9ASCO|nr:hypothetical protein KL937_004394 [Ogataea polymorpha]KAG7896740.1 hypothetical protein KL908_000142 [Ogataea polymorpha]KAG7903457.1 hypothetical protein KL935_000989 [Ogataea polymorpha]KAG7911938.1 hypothetical protein KL906_000142 [Ogataea polymorpha]KAG7913490.1 hypothetical protein KL907_000435 [Ogataea polymorpha]